MFFMVPLKKKEITSSTYITCEGIWNCLGPIIGPKSCESTKAERPLLKASSTIQNKRGNRGSPCRTPQQQGKKPINFPFIKIESLTKRRIEQIQLQKFHKSRKIEALREGSSNQWYQTLFNFNLYWGDFLQGYCYIIREVLAFYESSMERRDYSRGNVGKSICQHFGDDLELKVHQGDRPVIFNSINIQQLRNKNNDIRI